MLCSTRSSSSGGDGGRACRSSSPCTRPAPALLSAAAGCGPTRTGGAALAPPPRPAAAPGLSVGGCRLGTCRDWRPGLADARGLPAALPAKCAVPGPPHGGGKAVLPLPPGLRRDPARRRDLMLDLGDVVEDLGG